MQRQEKSRRPSRLPRWMRFTWAPEWLKLAVVGLLALVLFILGGGIVWASLVPIPSINDFENREVAQSTKIYDRTGNVLLYDVHGEEERTSVPLTQISPYIQQATISIEDDTFYTNAGFRPLSILRAAWADLTRHPTRRAARPSRSRWSRMRFSPTTRPSRARSKRSFSRCVSRVIIPKTRYLNTYLNETPYGGTIYGVKRLRNISSASMRVRWTSRRQRTSPRCRKRRPITRPMATTKPRSMRARISCYRKCSSSATSIRMNTRKRSRSRCNSSRKRPPASKHRTLSSTSRNISNKNMASMRWRMAASRHHHT